MNRNIAKTTKTDEFYTQRQDIEKELQYYTNDFRGKTVYCNCDDPNKSQFTAYFRDNFHTLGLKRLISTGHKERTPYFDGVDNVGLIYDGQAHHFTLKGDGDFRSRECIDLLKQADIICTNPPFSMFKEYIAQLIGYDKKFLIMGPFRVITHKKIFLLLQDRKIWLGTLKKGNMEFVVPEHYHNQSKMYRVDDKGNRYLKVSGVRWFTNLEYVKRHSNLILTEKYSPEKYPKYDNFDAVNVDRTANIPVDYAGVMGVPITFIDHYNANQFDILGTTDSWSGLRTKIYPKQIMVDSSGKRQEVTALNCAVALKIDGPISKTHYIVNGEYYKALYAHILIRNRKPTSS